MPRTAYGQGTAPRIGFMGFGTVDADAPSVAALREGLREQGLVEGQSIVVETRHAAGDVAAAGRMIAELAQRPVAAFIAPGPAATRSIRRATGLPIVAIGLPPGGDPELFASVSRPGGTVTGFSSYGEALSAKRIEILREAIPNSRTMGILHNATDPIFREWGAQTETSMRQAGLTPVRLTLSSTAPAELVDRLAVLKAQGGDAVVVIPDFLTHSLINEIVGQAHAMGIAVIAEQRRFVEAGALMSYGPDGPDLFRRAAGHVAKILRGIPPGDIPIEFPVRFELAVNLKTARMLSLAIPQTLLARADEVVE